MKIRYFLHRHHIKQSTYNFRKTDMSFKKNKKISPEKRGIINKIISDTHNHFMNYLPEKTSSVSSLLLNILFSGITIDNRQIELIQKYENENAIILYTSKRKSDIEYLFCHTCYKKHNIPAPRISFYNKIYLLQPISRIIKSIIAHIDFFFKNFTFPNPYKADYFKTELIKKKAGFFHLLLKKGFYRRFVKSIPDPIEYLINMQNSIKEPIVIIPQKLFFSIKPIRRNIGFWDIIFGSSSNPGRIKKLFLLIKTPKKAFLEFAEPINVKDFLNKQDIINKDVKKQSLLLKKELISHLNSLRQSILGPVLKSTDELKLNILISSELQEYMKQFSKRKNLPLTQVHKKANAYLDDIAASYTIGMIKFFSLVLKKIFSTLFEEMVIDTNGLTLLKEASKKGALILVPCHKSHLDYLLISYAMHKNNMPAPHIAAGKNLSFWPMGSIFRKSGAFFIRRSFKGAELYSKIFTAYVHKLLEEGFNIEFFIEGGRSRTGKLLIPQFGFLSILLNGYKNQVCKNMFFVPVNISYDRIIEEKSYIHEITGGEKNPENIKNIIKARKFLKKKYGKIYINFHKPIDLNNKVSEMNIDVNKINNRDLKNLRQELAGDILTGINKAAVATPHGIVAASILNCDKKLLSYKHLITVFETYTKNLISQNAKVVDTLFINQNMAFNDVLESFISRKFIESNIKSIGNNTKKIKIKINEQKRSSLEYYKNNCISFFIPAIFTATAILKNDAFLFSTANIYKNYNFLSDFFIKEFPTNNKKITEINVRKSIKSFIDDAIIIPHPTLPDTYNITSAGFRKLHYFAAFLKTFFESYSIVLNFLTLYPENIITSKDDLKKIQSFASRMYKRHEIERKESLSSITFQNAKKFFMENGVKSMKAKEKTDYYSEHIQNYLSILSQ